MGGSPCAGSSCYRLMFLHDSDDQFSKVIIVNYSIKKEQKDGGY